MTANYFLFLPTTLLPPPPSLLCLRGSPSQSHSVFLLSPPRPASLRVFCTLFLLIPLHLSCDPLLIQECDLIVVSSVSLVHANFSLGHPSYFFMFPLFAFFSLPHFSLVQLPLFRDIDSRFYNTSTVLSGLCAPSRLPLVCSYYDRLEVRMGSLNHVFASPRSFPFFILGNDGMTFGLSPIAP